MNNYPTTTPRVLILIELMIVIVTMISMKELLSYFEVVGAGSFGIWTGIVTATFFMREAKLSWKDLGTGLPKGATLWMKTIGIALLIMLVVFLTMGLILDPLYTQLGLGDTGSGASQFTFFLGKPLVFIGYLVTIVWFGAALGEELLMRGFILNRMNDLFGRGTAGFILALVLHGVLFGVLHSYQGIAGVITTGTIGVIFGLAYLLFKGKLVPLVLAHAMINTISLTAFYLNDGMV